MTSLQTMGLIVIIKNCNSNICKYFNLINILNVTTQFIHANQTQLQSIHITFKQERIFAMINFFHIQEMLTSAMQMLGANDWQTGEEHVS